MLSAKPESKAQAELKGIAELGRGREALAESERMPLFEKELNAKAKYLAEARDLQEVRRHEAVSKPFMTHRPVTVTILPELKRKRETVDEKASRLCFILHIELKSRLRKPAL